MRIRDILIVVVAVVAIIFGWIQESSLVIKNSFYVPLSDSDAAVHQLPAPIVTDLNGDGHPETILLPTREHLAVYSTGALSRSYDNLFVPLSHKFVAALPSPGIGFTTGHLTFPDNKSFVKAGPRRRRQHIAVVTDDYRLTLYNHKLDEVWSIALIAVQEATIIPYHACVQMLPERIFEQDLGSIVVSVAVGGPNSTERMAYFGINGATGEVRWKRTIDDYGIVDKLAETRNKLSFERIDRMIFSEKDLHEHSNEIEWHHFRESMVAALPHEYSHPWHNKLDAHHFYKPKNRKKRGHKQHDRHGHENAINVKYKNRYVGADENDIGELGEHLHMMQKGKKHMHHNLHRVHPNVMVHHGKYGIHVIHLYTGKVVTRLMPLKAGVAYHDLDDDYNIDEVRTEIGSRQTHHHRHGMDEELRCSGVVSTGIPWTETPEFNATICDSEGLLSSMSLLTHFIRGDGSEDAPRADPLSLIGSHNTVSTYTRAVAPLVVQQHTYKGINMWKTRRRAVFLIDSGLLTCISPVSKQVLWRSQTDAVFDNKQLVEEASGGLHSLEESENRVKKHPHLAQYSFHAKNPVVHSSKTMHYGTDPYVLAVGNKVMAAVNARNGHLAKAVTLQSPPIAPVIVEDFNGDGTNDILVATSVGYYGYIVERQNGGSTTSILMVTTIALLALLYGAQRVMSDGGDEEGGIGFGDEFDAPIRHKVPVAKRSTD